MPDVWTLLTPNTAHPSPRASTDPLHAASFGVVADGTTDDSAALALAIAALANVVEEFDGYREGLAELVLPAGVIRITTSGLLSSIGQTKRGGYKLRGQGAESTILWLDPDGTASDKWFYDNGATLRTWGCVFEDICFAGGADWRSNNTVTDAGLGYSNLNSRIKGFKFTGPNWESAHMFVRCKFRWLEQVAEFAGSNNADTIRFDHCEFEKNKNVFLIENEQSLSISDIAGYVNIVYGHYLVYGSSCTGGGGNFTKLGGAIIMLADDAAADGFVVKMVDGYPSAANAPVLFSGVRVEARGTYSKLVKATGLSAVMILFDGCSVLNTGTVNKDMVELGGHIQMIADKCSFVDQEAGKAQFKITSATRYGRNPHLIFRASQLPADIHDNITWNGGFGRLTIDALCSSTTVGSTTTVVAMACDILGTTVSNSITNRTQTRFTAPIANNASITNTGEYVITLPPYSEIIEVWAKFEANAGTTPNVKIHIGNDDKSVTYATSSTQAFNLGGSAYATGIFKNAGTDAEDRKVRVWLTDGAGGAVASSINAAAVPMRSGVVWE